MTDLDDQYEREAVAQALTRWWQSQDIDPDDAAFVMSTMVGAICGMMADDVADMRSMLKILHKEMDRSGRSGLKLKSRYKKSRYVR